VIGHACILLQIPDIRDKWLLNDTPGPGTIIDALDPFEVFVVNGFNHKTGPTYLPENIWALSFEELMRDYFCPQGYNASNPSCAIGICLGIFGTSHHVDDPVLAYYYYAPPAS
jgi:hypothetical protein